MANLTFNIGGVRVSVGATGVRLGVKKGDFYVSKRVIKASPKGKVKK